MGSSFDDLFPDADETRLGELPAFPDTEADAIRAKARKTLDRRTPTDPAGNKRVKRGRRRLSADETRALTQQLATRYLSIQVAGNRELTSGDVRVLAILVRAARRAHGLVTDISVPEIANRAAVSHRQVQLTVKKLGAHPFNLVRRQYRKLRPGMNDTNVYLIDANCFSKGHNPAASSDELSPARPRRAQGEKNCEVKKAISDRYTSTSTSDAKNEQSSDRKVGCRKKMSPTDKSEKPSHIDNPSPELTRPRYRPLPNINPDDEALLRSAIDILRPDLILPRSGQGVVELVEHLLEKYIPSFDFEIWPTYVRKHGTRAYLAVVETLLVSCARAAGEHPIYSMAGYLGGILRKQQPNPAHTIATLDAKYGDALRREGVKLAGVGVPSDLLTKPLPYEARP